MALTALRPGFYQDDQFGLAGANEDKTGTPDDWTLTSDVIYVES